MCLHRLVLRPFQISAVVTLLLASMAGAQQPSLPPPATEQVDYVRHVEPLLRARCYSCHGPEAAESGLRLDVGKRALEGGDQGRVIIPGDSAASRLILVVAGMDEDLGWMPPEGEGTPLTESQVGLLRAWIDQGASWPKTDDATDDTDWWSLQPISPAEVPKVAQTRWVRNPIDAFVLAKLEQQGMTPAAEARPETLIRRLYLDLVGLLPPPEEVAAFLADPSDAAYDRLVDRLLASPHFGERWGRHWLDLARYADTDGYEKDRTRPYAWRYRDWVIRALNADMPFDQFTIEQVAGDMLPNPTADQLAATGFHRNTLHNTEGGIDPEEDRVKKTVDRTNTMGTIWLGMTIGCAQCHSHKYDPISQREYYGLYGFFNQIDEVDAPAPIGGDPQDDEAKVRAVKERSELRDTRVLIRGNFLDPGEEVAVGVPAVLPPIPKQTDLPNRLDLARWLVSRDNPLTARVTVNRYWARLFGQGIVRTVDDLGHQGELPTHPELLDWLAGEFQKDWRIKRLLRLIVTSATYRQSSRSRKEYEEQDPENRWLARQARHRVESEIVRDLALDAAGLLDRRVGGPSIRPPQPPGYSELTYANSAKWKVSPGTDAYRRGIYIFFQRTSPYPTLVTFDSPDANLCCAQRNLSNTPLQALTLWNDPVFVECARNLAKRVTREVPGQSNPATTRRARLNHLFRACLSRSPDDAEREMALALHRRVRDWADEHPERALELIGGALDGASLDELAGWVIVSRTIMNLDEFITRE